MVGGKTCRDSLESRAHLLRKLLSNDPALAGLDESEEVREDFTWRKVAGNLLGGLLHIHFGAVEQPISLAECARVLGKEAAPFHAYLIDASDFGGIAIRDHVGRHVLNDLRASAHNRMATDAAELMHASKTSENGVILNDDMAGESAIVGKNNMVANGAIVRDVSVGEEISMAADLCHGIRRRASIDGAEFAKAIPIADFEPRGFPCVFQVLRALSDGAIGVKFITNTRSRGPRNGHMRMELAAITKLDVGADVAERTYVAPLPKDG